LTLTTPPGYLPATTGTHSFSVAEMAADRQQLLDERAVERALARMAREIIERSAGSEAVSLIGIHRRGVQLAQRIADEIAKAEGTRPVVGSLDITLYRDDLMAIGPRPVVGETRLPDGGVDDRIVVIVDDVAYTGRTARAAMDELADFGRPRRILLCVLVDRGGRELPIQPDIVGRHLDVPEGMRVEVLVPELDGRLAVELGPSGGE
jgi:pyrimidine operon attenuation protein / uracil phosphoribosyltransferase